MTHENDIGGKKYRQEEAADGQAVCDRSHEFDGTRSRLETSRGLRGVSACFSTQMITIILKGSSRFFFYSF
jgi:hypothetical protein